MLRRCQKKLRKRAAREVSLSLFLKHRHTLDTESLVMIVEMQFVRTPKVIYLSCIPVWSFWRALVNQVLYNLNPPKADCSMVSDTRSRLP